uniref:Uncharacterized protein n=1 Tax=Oryza punctata TaxID=4537 RepID=A0A0E0JVW7_ORYPU
MASRLWPAIFGQLGSRFGQRDGLAIQIASVFALGIDQKNGMNTTPRTTRHEAPTSQFPIDFPPEIPDPSHAH